MGMDEEIKPMYFPMILQSGGTVMGMVTVITRLIASLVIVKNGKIRTGMVTVITSRISFPMMPCII